MTKEELMAKINAKQEEEKILIDELDRMRFIESVERDISEIATATKAAMDVFEGHGFTSDQAFQLALKYFENMLDCPCCDGEVDIL